jgi:hypothetical protein
MNNLRGKNVVKPKVIEAWTGPGRKDEKITVFKPEYDAIHIDMNKRGNTEWWYFDAHLDNGYIVVGFFRAKHERTGKTGVEITIYKPDGEKIQNVYDYKHSDLIASKELADIKIGKNFIKVDYSNERFPVYEVFLDEDGYGFNLKYTAEVPGWMPGKGYTKFGDLGEFGWVIPVPKAKVEGSIKVNNETMPVKGIGYHDHNWITLNLIKIVDFWHWGRIYSQNFTVVFAYIKCNKKMDDSVIQVFMLAKKDEILLSTGEFDLIQSGYRYDQKARNDYPQKLEISLYAKHKVILNVENIVDSENMLSDFNPILRILAKGILKLNPGYFRFNSNFSILVDQDGTLVEEKGKCLHEFVILKHPKYKDQI